MSSTTSDRVTTALRTEKVSSDWNLTSDQVAVALHDHIVGTTVVITGVSRNGLGAEAARVIAQHSPKLLILASREESNIAQVVQDIKEKASSKTEISPVVVDLGSQKSVRAAAARILELSPVVDVLINNAGIMMLPKFTTTSEGIEAHFGTNHLGHFLLTNLLMPGLLKSPHGGRVVNVSSAGAAGSPVRFDDYNFGLGKNYEPFLAYAQSKCANLLFSLELAKRFGRKGIVTFGLDPGGVATTELSRSIPDEDLVSRGWFIKEGEKAVPNPIMPYITAAQSVASYIQGSFDPSIKDKNGGTILACSFLTDLPAYCTAPDAAARLWALSEELVGETFGH